MKKIICKLFGHTKCGKTGGITMNEDKPADVYYHFYFFIDEKAFAKTMKKIKAKKKVFMAFEWDKKKYEVSLEQFRIFLQDKEVEPTTGYCDEYWKDQIRMKQEEMARKRAMNLEFLMNDTIEVFTETRMTMRN